MIKINSVRGDLSGISAKRASMATFQTRTVFISVQQVLPYLYRMTAKYSNKDASDQSSARCRKAECK